MRDRTGSDDAVRVLSRIPDRWGRSAGVVIALVLFAVSILFFTLAIGEARFGMTNLEVLLLSMGAGLVLYGVSVLLIYRESGAFRDDRRLE